MVVWHIRVDSFSYINTSENLYHSIMRDGGFGYNLTFLARVITFSAAMSVQNRSTRFRIGSWNHFSFEALDNCTKSITEPRDRYGGL